MHTVYVAPAKKKTADCPAKKLDANKQTKVTVNFANEQVLVFNHRIGIVVR